MNRTQTDRVEAGNHIVDPNKNKSEYPAFFLGYPLRPQFCEERKLPQRKQMT